MAVTEALDHVPLDGRLGSATMEGSSNATGVTPKAVRAGDPAALQTLVERRGPAVVAFCTLVCGPQMATRSAAEAFARFRAAVRDAVEVDGLDPEILLRGATRHAAASMARIPVGPPPHGRLRSRGTQTCEHVPTMLAARANGALGAADVDRLARHLDRCERCDAMAEIFRRGELAYQDPPFDTLGTETATALLEALAAVPTHGLGHAPAPGPDAPATEPLDGAFGHLPDLEDEVPLDATVAFDVAQVDEPAEQLDAADLAAEPLPDEAPLVDDDEDFDGDGETGEYELVYGNTAEWDQLTHDDEAEDAEEADEAEEAGEADEAVPAPPLAGGRRRGGGRLLTLALPVLVVAACVVGALAWAGVFGGNAPTPPQVQYRAPTGIEPPVTTPLPVKVRATAASRLAAVPPAAGVATSGTTPAPTTP